MPNYDKIRERTEKWVKLQQKYGPKMPEEKKGEDVTTMSDGGLNYDKIRERAEKRVKMQQEFKLHWIIYAVVNVFLWLIWLFKTDLLASLGVSGTLLSILQLPWPILVMLCWGLGLFIHGVVVYFEAGGGAEARERAVQQAIERERALRYGDSALDKPKRSAHLSDDGELVYDEEDETEAEEKSARPARGRSSKS
jgi:hypothetical protein